MPKERFKPVNTDLKESNGTVNKPKAIKPVHINFKKRRNFIFKNSKTKNLTKEIIHSLNLKMSKCATTSSIQINEEYLDCLIDTGAFTSFISEAYFSKRNFSRNPNVNMKNWVTANDTNKSKWSSQSKC